MGVEPEATQPMVRAFGWFVAATAAVAAALALPVASTDGASCFSQPTAAKTRQAPANFRNVSTRAVRVQVTANLFTPISALSAIEAKAREKSQ